MTENELIGLGMLGVTFVYFFLVLKGIIPD